MKNKKNLLLTLSLLAVFVVQAQNIDLSKVPGTVIHHSPKSSGAFVGSPSICILPNGDYVATCDYFGGIGTPVGFVYKSTDKGVTWTQKKKLTNHFWGGVFLHNKNLYIMGCDKQYGNVIIRKSTDEGETWSDPTSSENGLLLPKTANRGYHTSTTAVTIHNGRIWRAMESAPISSGWGADFKSFIMSAPIDADLLKASSWTKSNELTFDKTWNSKCNTWLEGNAVVAPDGSMKIMLRVDYRTDNNEKAALVDVSNDGKTISFDPTNFIDFPGGCKKFTVRYDQVSGKYWALSNYVPDYFLTSPNPIIERGRNTQALCSSTDLRYWTVNTIYLQHNDIYKHGFQYVDWVIEGDDIVATSRTAYDDGIGGADNCHNANMLTFHRITNFRCKTIDDSYKPTCAIY